jgi:hypothetical protein
MTKLYVEKLRPVMGEVISSGQLCSGAENITSGFVTVVSTIDYVNKYNLSAFLASYDLFKAFDRLYLPFLFKVLKANTDDQKP